jgi:hypothetical protein
MCNDDKRLQRRFGEKGRRRSGSGWMISTLLRIWPLWGAFLVLGAKS